MDDKPKNQIEYLRGRPIDDALTVIAHRDAQCEYQQAEIGKLQAEVERLREYVRKLEGMVEHGLGPDDMANDISINNNQ